MRTQSEHPLPDGVYAMLVTPFNQREDIDFEALRAEVAWCAREGAQGIVVAPSIGEFACLTVQERWRCFEVCYEEAAKIGPHFKTIAMTAATHTREMREHADMAQTIGYDAAQLIAPYYWIPDEAEVLDYYKAACDTGLPVVVYHNPRLSKFKMSRKFIAELAKLDGVIGIKEVETDRHVELEPLFKEVGEVNEHRTRQNKTYVKIFTTFRAFFDGYMLGSGGGFINIFAVPACLALWKACRDGKFCTASALQTRINETFPRGNEANKRHIGTTKVAASIVTGIPMGSPRHPYQLPSVDVEALLRHRCFDLQKKIASLT